MRADAHPTALHRIGERAEVALEWVELDDERWRVNVLDPIANARRRPVHAGAIFCVRW
jgi:hypothetical protein